MKLALLALLALALGSVMGCSASSDDAAAAGGSCNPADADGVMGGSFVLDVTIADTGFTPVVVQVQNSSTVKLTVHNTGTKAHSFVVGCLTVPGCTSCPPAAAKVGPLDPGATRTVTFAAPSLEGLYPVTSDVAGDAFTGQLSLN